MIEDFNLEITDLEKLNTNKSLYDLLEVKHDASHLEIKTSYLRQKQLYDSNSLAFYSLTNEAADQTVSKLNEAYKTLSCEISRKKYDKELAVKPQVIDRKKKTKALSTKLEVNSQAERVRYFDSLCVDFNSGSGAILKSFRLWTGLEYQEVQAVTKIHSHILEAIENESFQLLPNIVYVKGFLDCILKYYGLENSNDYKDQYMERFKNWKQKSNR